MTLPPCSWAPREAASMAPPSPPVTTVKPSAARPRPISSARPAISSSGRDGPTTAAYLRGPLSFKHPSHKVERTALEQRVVQVPALRRLHARRAPRLARAFGDQAARVPDEPLELLEAPMRDAHAAGMAVVDEDGGD